MMNRLVDKSNRNELRELLLTLDAATHPLWGKMKPQQMVEHLVDEVKYSNGKKVATCDLPAEAANQSKQKWIYTDAVIPRNLVVVDIPEEYEFEDIETAISQLMHELNSFDHYLDRPGVTAVHGGYGPMNYDEWVIWHNKHFMHHLKQFNLIPVDITVS
jgi:oxepin-CoA hydrolase/3-oxo-5,6-dehydrosuberyl-CoA semialdehyde dehydrogenase